MAAPEPPTVVNVPETGRSSAAPTAALPAAPMAPLPPAPVAASPAAPLPAAPSLAGSVRTALSDLYYNSWRLVPMNLVWGAMVLAILFLGAAWSGLALLGLPLLALPTAGMARMSALIVREQPVALSDGFGAWRRFGVAALALGIGFLLAAGVLSINVLIGLRDGGLATVAVATLAAWGLIALAAFAAAAWPLLVDPARDAQPLRERLRLAGLFVVAHPGRAIAMTALIGAFLAVSTAAFAALLTVSVAVAMQTAARYVLPAADRLERRMAQARAARASRTDAG